MTRSSRAAWLPSVLRPMAPRWPYYDQMSTPSVRARSARSRAAVPLATVKLSTRPVTAPWVTRARSDLPRSSTFAAADRPALSACAAPWLGAKDRRVGSPPRCGRILQRGEAPPRRGEGAGEPLRKLVEQLGTRRRAPGWPASRRRRNRRLTKAVAMRSSLAAASASNGVTELAWPSGLPEPASTDRTALASGPPTSKCRPVSMPMRRSPSVHMCRRSNEPVKIGPSAR